jgi:pimeloyl-ACP methyl ester carboxylesterase
VQRNHLYPGKLYDLGGYNLHLFCLGTAKSGSPTVVFESRTSGDATDWIPLQAKLSQRTQVCAYDRAGLGWSDEWPAIKNSKPLHAMPARSMGDNVDALAQLLSKAGISTPVILVGHSYGGALALSFEKKYPNRVQGLVLLDPHDDGVPREDLRYDKEITAALHDLEKESLSEGRLAWEARLTKSAQLLQEHKQGKISAQELIEELNFIMHSLDPLKSLRSEFSQWLALHSGCAELKLHPSKTLKNKYLTVISSDPSDSHSESQTYLHMNTAQLSTKGRFVIALNTGHGIHVEKPDLTLKVINQMLDNLEGKKVARLTEEDLPQYKKKIRFFVDGKLADHLQKNSTRKEEDPILKNFCTHLHLGFVTHKEAGYFSDPKTGIQGYYVMCE